jgi:Tol biopolymer transport system component
VVELNTELEDDDPWLSPDGSTIVFASDRDEAGDVDLFIAVRTAR